MTHLDRRSFLQAAAMAPLPFTVVGTGHWVPRGEQRMLLVLELEGGNDGLNTVIPIGDPQYPKLRPRLSEVRRGAHELDGGIALHRVLRRLHTRLQDGGGAVVHGVGYRNPDRSHFRSRDIWHTADPQHQQVRVDTTGWLGRAADRLASDIDVPAASIGSLEVPLLLRGRKVQVPCLQRVEDFTLQVATRGGKANQRRALQKVIGGQPNAGALLGYIARTASAAAEQADELRQALQRYAPKTEYPESALGRELGLAARMAVAGFGTRLFHLGFGGFDTHAQQLPTHQGLLAQLDAALDAFLDDLEGHGLLDRTVVLVHSEFGRRAAENQSQGTDHGAAAPLFVLGGGVRPGQHGVAPDLGALVDGDVPVTTDFRAVYADLLQWLRMDPGPVIGDAVQPLGLWPP